MPFAESPLRWAGALLAPWIVLALPLAGVSLRMMRASMTDVLDEDYLRTAKAKGLSARTVVRRHAIPRRSRRCSRLTTVTMPVVVTNLVLIEQVFSIPGVFTGMKRGIAAGDFDLLFALTAVAAGFVAVAGLLADFALHWLDPRMRARAAMSARAWAGFAAMSLDLGHPLPVHQGRGRRRHARRPSSPGCACMLAAAILLALAAAPGCCGSLRGNWRWLLAYALAEIVIPFPLIAAGEQHVSSVAGGDPDRGGAAVHRAAGDPLRPRGEGDRPPARRPAWSGSPASSC